MSNSLFLGVFGPFQALSIVAVVLIIVGFLLVSIFFNITLQKSMAAVSKPNRAVDPAGLIWLNFIPLCGLNWVWTVIYTILVCTSINKDAKEKIAPLALAIVIPIVGVIQYIISIAFNIMIDGGRLPDEEAIPIVILMGVTSLAVLILGIIFWVKLNAAKNKLLAMDVDARGKRSSDDILDNSFSQSNEPSLSESKTPVSPTVEPKEEKVEEDRYETLKKYKELLDQGVITLEEFEKKKKELLG